MKVRDLLLKALGHGDCVSREHQRAEYEVRSAYLTERDEAVARAGHAERELERVKQERAGMLNRVYRIPPNDDTDGHPGETWREFAADADMARIEAEREWNAALGCNDALAADNDRLREALGQIRDNPYADRLSQMRARVALSADADTDAEPSTCGAPHDICGTWCDLPEGHDGECRCACDADAEPESDRLAIPEEPEAPSLGNIIGYRGPSRAEGEES